MKIFEIIYNDDEKQWVAAYTNIEALQEVLSSESTDIDLMKEIKELQEDKWDKWYVNNLDYDENYEEDEENWDSVTFRQFLNNCKSTTIISSTFYENNQ